MHEDTRLSLMTISYLLVQLIAVVEVYQAHEAQDTAHACNLASLVCRSVQCTSGQSRHSSKVRLCVVVVQCIEDCWNVQQH